MTHPPPELLIWVMRFIRWRDVMVKCKKVVLWSPFVSHLTLAFYFWNSSSLFHWSRIWFLIFISSTWFAELDQPAPNSLNRSLTFLISRMLLPNFVLLHRFRPLRHSPNLGHNHSFLPWWFSPLQASFIISSHFLKTKSPLLVCDLLICDEDCRGMIWSNRDFIDAMDIWEIECSFYID